MEGVRGRGEGREGVEGGGREGGGREGGGREGDVKRKARWKRSHLQLVVFGEVTGDVPSTED